MEYIKPYLDYFSANPEWAIVIVFLIAFGEALLIIGLFVPSTAVLVGAGMLVGTGHLEFWPVFLATAVGAIAGDQVSFWAGRMFGERLKTLWPLNRYPQLVARGEDFVRQHGGKSIAIGRFVPGVKAVVPGIVGMFGMGQLFFVSVNFSSGLVWAAAHVLPGILLGQGLAMAGELSGRLVVVLLVLFVVLALAGWLARLLGALATPYIDHLLRPLSQWAKSRGSRSMHRLGRALAPENPRSTLIVLFVAVIVVALIVLLDLLTGLVLRNAVSNLDISVNNLMAEIRNAPADELMISLSMLGDPPAIVAMMGAIVVWLVLRRAWRAALAAAVVTMAAGITARFAAHLFMRPGPAGLNSSGDAFFGILAFPSWHATVAAVAFGVLAALASHAMSRWSRAIVIASCSLMVVAIGFSQVYLGISWLSDVLGGFLIGAMLVAAFGVVIEAVPPRRFRPLGLLGFAFLVFVAAGTLHIKTSYDRREAAFAPRDRIIELSLAEWQASGWQGLPVRRIDLAGRTEEIFAAQYIGPLETLEGLGADHAWQPQPKWTWAAGIAYLDPHAELASLPPRPALHEGLQAKFTAIVPDAANDGSRLVLRAYKTSRRVVLPQGAEPVFLISLAREALRPHLNLYTIPAELPAAGNDREELINALRTDSQLQAIPHAGGPEELLPIFAAKP
jgi:undecaprenyl-diphosphatase